MSASGLTNRRPNAYRSRPRAIARRCNPSLPWTLLAQHHRETQLPACQLDRRKSAHILTRRASEGRWPRQVQDAQSIPSLARRLVWTVGDPSVSRYRIAVPVRARTVGAKTEKNRRNPLTGSHLLPCPEKVALSPNSGPRPVLRPPGFALPEPLRRPADPNSPRWIANPC